MKLSPLCALLFAIVPQVCTSGAASTPNPATTHTITAVTLGGGGLLGFSVADADGVVVGDLRLDLMATGAFTASLDLNRKLYHFNGVLSNTGSYAGIASTSNDRQLSVTLTVSIPNSTITASIDGGQFTASQALGALTAAGRAALKGRFTVELPPVDSTTANGTTISVDATATAAYNSPTLTLAGAVPAEVEIGWTVAGNGIPTGATVTGIDGDIVTISANSTAAISASAVVLSGPINGVTSETSSPEDIPQGTGWMVIKLDAYGSAELEGMAGDGQAFSTRVFMGGSDLAPTLPFYWSKDDDTLAGSLAITPGTGASGTSTTTTLAGSTITGTVTYIRAKSNSPYYPRGFNQSITATGAAYIPPEPRHRTLEGSGYSAKYATLSISGSNVLNFADSLDFSEADRCSVIDSNPYNLNVRFRDNAGVVGGTFQDPASYITVHYAGVVLQSTTSVGGGAGVFRDANKAGTVTLTLTADTTTTTTTGSTSTTGATTTGTTATGTTVDGAPITTVTPAATTTATGTTVSP